MARRGFLIVFGAEALIILGKLELQKRILLATGSRKSNPTKAMAVALTC